MDPNLNPDKNIRKREPDKENHREIKQENIKPGKDDSKELIVENRRIEDKVNQETKEDKKDKKAHERAICTMVILKVAMMVAGIVLVSWCENTKSNKPCDIQEAVKSLRLNFSVPCKYERSMDKIKSVWKIGIASFVLDFIFLILSLFLWLVPPKRQKTGYLAVYAIHAIKSLVISVLLLLHHKDIVDSKMTQKDTDYGGLKSAMIDSLNSTYASDVITINDTMSDRWNNFFIKYDCCAVNQVISTTNDFDTTPWCTTSGSCQLTNSQIPKSCCKDVTANDYQGAPDICHATVTAGTYRDSCFTRVRMLGNLVITECQIDVLATCLFTLGIMKVLYTVAAMSVVLAVICSTCKKNENCKIYPKD